MAGTEQEKKHDTAQFGALPQGDFCDFASTAAFKLTDEDFGIIRQKVYTVSGINLTEQKRSLVVSRLQSVLRAKGYKSFSEYCKYLKDDESGRAVEELVNRISTNHTFFYREKAHFDFFVNRALPEAMAAAKRSGDNDLRIWSAACSTGEEPYTLAMLMHETLGRNYSSWNGGVLATDISGSALEIAKRGIYPEERLNLLPKDYLRKYFVSSGPNMCSVNERIKKEVTFRRFNLMNKSFPFKKGFHVIFCRNVMIYFDQTTRDELVARLFQYTMPGGYLFVGHSESLGRERCPYSYIQPAVYQKQG